MQIPPQKGQRYDEYEPNKYDCISVNDDYIEDILEKLSDIDFYWHTLDVKGKGLEYCGVTLIPPSSMQKFITVIENIPELHQLKEENKELLTAIKECLNDKVKEVRLTSNFKNYPVALTSVDMFAFVILNTLYKSIAFSDINTILILFPIRLPRTVLCILK